MRRFLGQVERWEQVDTHKDMIELYLSHTRETFMLQQQERVHKYSDLYQTVQLDQD